MCLWGMGWVFWRLWEKMGVESHGVGWGAGGRCFFEGGGEADVLEVSDWMIAGNWLCIWLVSVHGKSLARRAGGKKLGGSGYSA